MGRVEERRKRRYNIETRLLLWRLGHLFAVGRAGEARHPPLPNPFRVGIAPGPIVILATT